MTSLLRRDDDTITCLAERMLPVERGFVLDHDDRARREVIGKLMCDGEADLGQISVEHGLDAESYFANELAALVTIDDLAAYDRETRRISTTSIGRLLVRNVCMVFDRYHRTTTGFSPTI